MFNIKIIFGQFGDNGVTSLIYEVINSLPNKYDINVDIETNLLYDYTSPTVEINGRRIIFSYSDESEAKEKIRKLIKGEIIDETKPSKIPIFQDNVFSDGVVAF
ncbi:hypothetical protein DFR86_07250 [Acidianus sulfidivorans JP7]|uniref:Uncharacterized protein n=1 Tax=Acidianus sulfidivorans JP7 TaxID=619593 RepID=A0A2U9IN45_9CREN|nr:hypothetical protein [Acidianus sulfidivorans]AWR97364.1 hypothetical protein DFR86_07250 [Acidianus sulfidivorans JP7]